MDAEDKKQKRKEEFGIVGVFFVMNERTFWLCSGPASTNRGWPFPIPSFSLPRVFDDSQPAHRPLSFSIVICEEIHRLERGSYRLRLLSVCAQLAG